MEPNKLGQRKGRGGACVSACARLTTVKSGLGCHVRTYGVRTTASQELTAMTHAAGRCKQALFLMACLCMPTGTARSRNVRFLLISSSDVPVTRRGDEPKASEPTAPPARVDFRRRIVGGRLASKSSRAPSRSKTPGKAGRQVADQKHRRTQ